MTVRPKIDATLAILSLILSGIAVIYAGIKIHIWWIIDSDTNNWPLMLDVYVMSTASCLSIILSIILVRQFYDNTEEG